MLQKENLYFIAIIPPAEICDAITGFKQDFADRFSCKAALKLVPHITLKAPFKLAPPEHAPLLEWFQKLNVPFQSFNIELRDFGVFPKKYSPVVFVQPLMNEHLGSLQTAIQTSFKTAFPQIKISETEMKFHPHITIAYRDLDPKIFVEAWKEYGAKEYHAMMKVNNFHLLQHDGKNWNVIASYFLNQAGS